MALSISSGSMLNVRGSMSTNTGVAPVRAMEPAVAKKVNGVVMASSPGPRPSAIMLHRSASVPLETPTAYLQSLIAAISRSSSATLGPPMQTWESSVSATAASTCSRIAACCALRSSSGTFIGFLDKWPRRNAEERGLKTQPSYVLNLRSSAAKSLSASG